MFMSAEGQQGDVEEALVIVPGSAATVGEGRIEARIFRIGSTVLNGEHKLSGCIDVLLTLLCKGILHLNMARKDSVHTIAFLPKGVRERFEHAAYLGSRVEARCIDSIWNYPTAYKFYKRSSGRQVLHPIVAKSEGVRQRFLRRFLGSVGGLNMLVLKCGEGCEKDLPAGEGALLAHMDECPFLRGKTETLHQPGVKIKRPERDGCGPNRLGPQCPSHRRDNLWLESASRVRQEKRKRKAAVADGSESD